MIEVKAYKCDFCPKRYAERSKARRHEEKCFHDPSNRSCKTCGNLQFEDGPYCEAEIEIEHPFYHDQCERWTPKESLK